MGTPERLGKYRIVRELARGSMGVVYEGFDPSIQRRLAIKVVRVDELAASERGELHARLEREAQAAGRLNHPGIVAVYDFGEDVTASAVRVGFIAMELVDGIELKVPLDAGRQFSGAEIVRIMTGILEALQHAHERGVIHRDVKPGNVLLMPDGGIKLTDFGVARLENSEMTQAGTIIGSPQYMSPEQLLGLPVDGRADLFSCGVILYQFLTGVKPFTGSVTTVMHQVLNVDPPRVTSIKPALSRSWDAVLSRALAKKPEDRFQEVGSFIAAVRRAAVDDDADATVIRPLAVDTVMRAARPHRKVWHVALAGVMLVIAGLVTWILRGGGSDRSADKPPATQAAQALPASAVAPVPALPASTSTRQPPQPVAEPPAPTPSTTSVPTAERPVAQVPAGGARPPPPLKVAAPSQRPAAVLPGNPVARTAAQAPASGPPAAIGSATASVHSDEWQLQRQRVASSGAGSLGLALKWLLNLASEEHLRTVTELDKRIRKLPPDTGIVLGRSEGLLTFYYPRQASAISSAARLLAICQRDKLDDCQIVVESGRGFNRSAFDQVASKLGQQSLFVVRTRATAAVERLLPHMAQAGTPTDVVAPSSPPSASVLAPTSAAPTPSNDEWQRARAAYLRPPRPTTLAGALIALLQIVKPDEVQAVRAFESKMIGRPVYLAMGVKEGLVVYGWDQATSEQDGLNARSRAIGKCQDTGAPICHEVLQAGQFSTYGFKQTADRLEIEPPAKVRQALIDSFKR